MKSTDNENIDNRLVDWLVISAAAAV